jgi:hypothetical protein
MSLFNAGESTASQSFALTCRGLLFFAMIGGAFFAICLAQANNPQLPAAHGENQNMQTMSDETDGYGAYFSVALACISPRLSRFEVEFGRGSHIYTVLRNIGDVLAAVKLNRQVLIVYTIK